MAEYDRLINWERFYARYLDNMKPCSTNKVTARCPFHDDQHNSFWFNVDNGLWKCEACGKSGNAQTFLELYEKIDSREAYKKLMIEAGLWDEEGKKKTKLQKYTLEDYAEEKKLPLDFLQSLGLKTIKSGVQIPYYDEAGEVLRTRIRHHPQSPVRFTWGKGNGIYPYGLWRIKEAYEKGYIIVVEGESDTHTLWYHGYPALGIPGATSFNTEWARYFERLKVYISQEPPGEKTDAGKMFVEKICSAVRQLNINCRVFKFTVSEYKDPSGLHIDNPELFKQRFDAILESAQEINLEEINLTPKREELIPGAPIQLVQPEGFRIKQDGVSIVDEKTGALKCICKTPLLITSRLKSLETGEEKIEIAFFRDNKWHRIITNRSTVFQTRTITQLADYGLTVSSENAKAVVKYLTALEFENMDTLPLQKSVTQLGWWQNNFLPFYADDIVIDIEPSMQRWLAGYSPMGKLQDWVDFIKPFRDNLYFRFYLAAGFAAPLLKICNNHRTFIVHLWGDSRSGKTAALKAALSIYGDPEVLMASFNATNVGLERMAAFYNDLPLGIDEKQVANNQEFIDRLVYMLSLGTSKIRGSKTGLQAQKSWRSVILTTGEESIIQEHSMTGIGTRVLELYGTPFNSELEAKTIHETLTELYGTAGPFFIGKLRETNAEEIREKYREVNENLTAMFPKKPGSYISAASIIYIADAYSSKWLFGEKDKSKTAEMVVEILNKLEDSTDIDISEKGYQFIIGWIAEHKPNFSPDLENKKEQYGIEEEDYVYVLPHILEKAFKEYGLPFRKVIRKLAEKGLIESEVEYSTGFKRFTVVKWFNNKATRFIKIKLPKEKNEEQPPF